MLAEATVRLVEPLVVPASPTLALDPESRDWLRSLESTGAARDEAVELAAPEAPFTVVLLDVMMPGSDGPATLQRLRSGPLDAQTPVVFLTAKVLPADRRRLHGLGAAGVIAKPFDPMLLSQQLRAILAAGPSDGPGEIS